MPTRTESLVSPAWAARNEGRFKDRMGVLCDEIERYRQSMEGRFWNGVVLLAVTAFVLIRHVDPAFALPLTILASSLAAITLQQIMIVYQTEVRSILMPALCEAAGRLRHQAGFSSDLRLDEMVHLGLLPQHNRRVIDDIFVGEHRSHPFMLATIDVWLAESEWGAAPWISDRFQGLVAQIGCPERPACFHGGTYRKLAAGRTEATLCWADGLLLFALPDQKGRFEVGSLFQPLRQWLDDLDVLLADVQLPHRLIDWLTSERDTPTALSS